MTYIVGWKSKNQVYICGDSAVHYQDEPKLLSSRKAESLGKRKFSYFQQPLVLEEDNLIADTQLKYST